MSHSALLPIERAKSSSRRPYEVLERKEQPHERNDTIVLRPNRRSRAVVSSFNLRWMLVLDDRRIDDRQRNPQRGCAREQHERNFRASQMSACLAMGSNT